MEKLVPAIKDLHLAGWAHQDIRLPNICFDDSFEPIFIDLDRCRRNNKYIGVGCMYNKQYNSFRQDWLQLGLLVSWVINPGNNYHSDERLTQEFDSFVGALILKGRCEDSKFEQWKNNRGETVQSVISSRCM